MLIRLCKVFMLLSLSFFAFLVTFSNITDYDSNYQFVRHVLSMDTTFPNNAAMYRAITTEWVWNAAYWLIIFGEGLTCIFLLIGGLSLLGAIRLPANEFNARKTMAVLGCTAGFAVWFLGFMAIGGEWFLMWQSETWNGQEAAFRFYVSILGVLVFVMLPEPE
ncbi:MAG: DUF2165 domain-containing protein [Pseudomonadota bacterium]